MKKLRPGLLLLSVVLILGSCDPKQKIQNRVSFDRAFPKPNKNLSEILSNRLQLKNGPDTASLFISSSRTGNLITNAAGDTLFSGKVSRFRGLYYFSQALNDTSYLIHAVKITGNQIYGLRDAWYQAEAIDDQICDGKFPELIKYISPDSSVFRLSPEKRPAESFSPASLIRLLRTPLSTLVLNSGKSQQAMLPTL